MKTTIFDKTDKGREEIATRQYRLAPRLRSMLVLIDGKHDIDDLLKKVAGLGLDEHHLAELLDAGFIQEVQQKGSGEAVPSLPSQQTDGAQTPSAAEPASKAADVLPEGENQFEAIYHFYNETIKSTVGLRGYGLQLKVERAESIEDFRALRDAYLEAVRKAKGNEMARSLRDRLDQLLYLGETPPPHTTIIGQGSTSG